MKNTKLESLKQSSNNTAAQEIAIINKLRYHGPQTRRSLATLFGVESNSVCQAVRNLLDEGLLIESGTMWDAETQRNQKRLVVSNGQAPTKEPKINKDEYISHLEITIKDLEAQLFNFHSETMNLVTKLSSILKVSK